MNRIAGWAALIFVTFAAAESVLAADGATRSPTEVAVTVSQRPGWTIAETSSFRCEVQDGCDSASQLALCCEQSRQQLAGIWLTDSQKTVWVPRCQIVVHASQSAYNSCLGRPGDASVGSTRLNFDGERVIVRRIDLRADATDWKAGALPHELTHVVLGERFRGRPIPRWADEGIAMLNESATKRDQRLADLRQTLQARPTYRIRDLLSVQSVPPPHLRDAFYGQSLALTSWFIENSSPREFAALFDRGTNLDLNAVLQSEFGIAGVEGLQAEWNQWTRAPEQLKLVNVQSTAPPIGATLASDSN